MEEPEKITNKQARRDFNSMAPYILAVNLIAAIAVFLLSDMLFKQEEAYLGGLLAGAFTLIGVFSYAILKLMGKKLTQVDRKSKD